LASPTEDVMDKIHQAQARLIRSAAEAPDRITDAPARDNAAAGLAALAARGFIISLQQTDTCIRLIVTKAGRPGGGGGVQSIDDEEASPVPTRAARP